MIHMVQEKWRQDAVIRKDFLSLLRDLCNIESGLNDWQIDFIDNMVHRSKDPDFLPSERQWNKMQEIYDKCC